MIKIVDGLSILLANTYALYLKTQNYHWHVKGAHFQPMHVMFEGQYQALALAVDNIAERILILGHSAPASFKAYDQLKTIKDGDAEASSDLMVSHLIHDHTIIIDSLLSLIKLAQELNDEGTVSLLNERLSEHEKTRWMLRASHQAG